MKRSESNSLHRDEKPGTSRQEDDKSQPRPKSEDERIRRRREWKIQLQREREHEKLKEKMILDYEIRRAQEKGLPAPPRRSTSATSLSKSRSESMESRRRTPSPAKSPRQPVVSPKKEALSGMKPQLFKGPTGTRISASELRKIKIDIHRNIPVKAAIKGDLQRDIVNPEDVVLKRRDGAKPIFEREEIKKGTEKEDEIEERRTVMTVDETPSASSTQRSKRRSASLSPASKRSYSAHRALSRHSRRETDNHQSDKTSHRDEHKSHSRDRSREQRERHRVSSDRRKESSRAMDNDRRSRSRGRSKEHERRPRSKEKSPERKDRHRERDDRRREEQDTERSHHRRENRDRSREKSREREGRGRDRDHYRRSDKEDRFRDRSRDRRDRDRSRDRSRDRRLSVPSQYIEPVPVPVYYGNFPPRPIMVGPILPFRGQIPVFRGRHPGVMGPVRPFPPRFQPPPDLYRLGMPPPRFGRMF